MIETSIFDGRILPTLPHHSPSFPSCRPSNGMAQRQRDSHLCCDLSDLRRNTWVFTVHGLIVASLIPMAVILFWQLWHIWNSSLMHTCIWRVRMWTCLKHRFNIFATHGGLFLNQFCEVQSKRVPNTWREKCCRFEILWTFRRTSKPCLRVQLYVAISIYVYNIYINKYIHICISYIYIYIYIYMIVEVIHIRTYGGLNPMVIPSFPAELHPSAESDFDSPEIIQDHPVVPTIGCLFQFNFALCGLEVHHHYQKLYPYGHSHNLYGDFLSQVTKSSESIMVTADPPWLELQPWYFRISSRSPFLGVKIVTVPSNRRRIWG